MSFLKNPKIFNDYLLREITYLSVLQLKPIIYILHQFGEEVIDLWKSHIFWLTEPDIWAAHTVKHKQDISNCVEEDIPQRVFMQIICVRTHKHTEGGGYSKTTKPSRHLFVW